MSSQEVSEGQCRICGEDNPTMLREHQLVPEEYYEGTSKGHFSTVVCANHKAVLESLYDETVFQIVSNSVDVDGGDLGWGKSLAENINNGDWPNRDRMEVLPGLELHRLFNQAESLKDAREVLLDEYTRRREREDRQHRERTNGLKQLIADVEDDHEEGAPIDEVVERADELDLDRSVAEDEIEKLRKKGEVYQPRTDHLRTM